MKIVKISGKGDGVLLENNGEEKWFSMSVPVQKFIKNLDNGTEVTIETDKANKVVTRINPLGKSTVTKTEPHVHTTETTKTTVPSTAPVATQATGVGGVHSREESIVRQSVLKAVGSIVSGIAGVDRNNWREVTREVFDYCMDIVTKK